MDSLSNVSRIECPRCHLWRDPAIELECSCPITMTIAEASARLGISVWLGRRLAKQGKFPGAFMIGGLYRVHRATFDREVERMATGQLPTENQSDEILQRALGDVSLQLTRRRRSSRG